jgi:hypothetical protein
MFFKTSESSDIWSKCLTLERRCGDAKNGALDYMTLTFLLTSALFFTLGMLEADASSLRILNSSVKFLSVAHENQNARSVGAWTEDISNDLRYVSISGTIDISCALPERCGQVVVNVTVQVSKLALAGICGIFVFDAWFHPSAHSRCSATAHPSSSRDKALDRSRSRPSG